MCSKNDSLVRIDLKRCPCIHSLAQLVDVTLQSLLYQRQMIPEPASTLLHGCTPVADQFRTTYQKVQQILRGTFRSANGDGRIREFVILLGATPFSPKEIYRVRVPPTICRPSPLQNADKIVPPTTPEGRRTTAKSAAINAINEIGAGNANGGREEEDSAQNGGAGRGGGTDSDTAKCRCGGATVCDALNAKERRLVFSAVALSKTAVAHFEGCKVPGKMEKVFMFIRTSGPLVDCGGAEGLEEDDSFEVPDREMKRRRKIRQLRIQVNAPCIQQPQNQQQQPSRQRHRKNSDEKETRAEDGTTTEENDENEVASGGGRRQPRAATVPRPQQRLRSSGVDNGGATPTRPASAIVGRKKAGGMASGCGEQYNRSNADGNANAVADDDQPQDGNAAHRDNNSDDEGREEEGADEEEEEEEMASSTWYRLGPFFTNLS